MVAGTIIGSAIFVQPSAVTGFVPSVTGIALVWLTAGILTLLGALVCAELASTFTQSGGVYVYLKEAFSPAVGFLWGWAMFWIMHSGIIAAIAVIFARYVGYFVPLGDLGTKLVAIACIMVLSAVNYVGVKHGSALQAIITLAKILAIVLMIILGFAVGAKLPEHFVTASSPGTGVTISNFMLALVAGLFTYGGWHMVAYNSEETIEPRKTIPRALILGTIIVTCCYIAMTAVYMYILPLEKVATSTRVAADAANALFGFGGGAFMSGLVVVSAFGSLTGIILAGPRVYYAMARDGLLFKWIGNQSQVQDANQGHNHSGHMVGSSGSHRDLLPTIQACYIHRVDIFRPHGSGAVYFSPSTRNQTRLSYVGLPHHPGHIYCLVICHRHQPDYF